MGMMTLRELILLDRLHYTLSLVPSTNVWGNPNKNSDRIAGLVVDLVRSSVVWKPTYSPGPISRSTGERRYKR
jgi:hypothetical protein